MKRWCESWGEKGGERRGENMVGVVYRFVVGCEARLRAFY